VFAGAAAVMQAVESQTLILYHTDLRGQWPEERARALAARLPYLKRLAVSSGAERAHSTLAGVALALRALTRALGRDVRVSELLFAPDEKPRLAAAADGARAAADFSVAHSGPLVGCAALRAGRVGLDVEVGSDGRLESWVAREAVVKAAGLGMRAVNEVELSEAGARCRGEHWHARRLDQFPGAAACVMTSVALVAVEARQVPLAELFAL
jgi:phosphopantetheinyl transferase